MEECTFKPILSSKGDGRSDSRFSGSSGGRRSRSQRSQNSFYN